MEFDPRYSSGGEGTFPSKFAQKKECPYIPHSLRPFTIPRPKKYMGEGRKEAKTNKFLFCLLPYV